MTTTTSTETVEQLPLDAIIPDPDNRKVVLDAQFVGSIRTHGVIQPLLVSPHPDHEGRFHLVAGHRRLAAARKVGLGTVPALIRNLTEQQALELSLVDNLQREDLNPLERSGSHSIVRCGTCQTVIPIHTGDLPTGTLRAIERDLAPCLGEGWLK